MLMIVPYWCADSVLTGQVVKEMRNTVPSEDAADLDLVMTGAAELSIYTELKYPGDKLIFRADPSYRGEAWFDFAWIAVEEQQGVTEVDPLDATRHRVLVRLRGFCTWKEKDYALCEYFRPATGREDYFPEGLPPHPIFKRYRWSHQTRRGRRVAPFYVVPLGCVVGAVTAFREADVVDRFAHAAVTVVPSFVELCGGKADLCPSDDMLPKPPTVLPFTSSLGGVGLDDLAHHLYSSESESDSDTDT